jgi:hypothetical protein
MVYDLSLIVLFEIQVQQISVEIHGFFSCPSRSPTVVKFGGH